MTETAEQTRLLAANTHQADWKKWGPCLSERAYRWNEDGLMGICDNSQYLCFALALWEPCRVMRTGVI